MTRKEQIQRALNITADEYAAHVEQTGYRWIRWYFGNHAETVRPFAICRLFWLWWINQWEIREEAFIRVTGIDLIEEPLQGIYLEAAINAWMELHQVGNITTRPNSLVRAAISKMLREEEAKLETLTNPKHTQNA